MTPEPAGAPSESADGRLICLGGNEPPDVSGSTLTLPGWVRTFADPTNSGGAPPAVRAEAFDPSGVSIGTAFSDTVNGRLLISVPVRPAGFEGWVSVHADGFLDVTIFSSLRYTNTAVAGWVWLTTAEERDAVAAAASVALEPGTGILIGAVHDCDVFGSGNVVIRHGTSTDGVVYFTGFDPDPALTFTDA
ncbi:MAG: hypothetical protein GXP55_02185, partial [Deltaproteobacteria bacterium]|nr:hypothetical protein [Deltaproteobacteria bacterium]